jgi:hypothetical protein
MYFIVRNTFKSNCYHTLKHLLVTSIFAKTNILISRKVTQKLFIDKDKTAFYQYFGKLIKIFSVLYMTFSCSKPNTTNVINVLGF